MRWEQSARDVALWITWQLVARDDELRFAARNANGTFA